MCRRYRGAVSARLLRFQAQFIERDPEIAGVGPARILGLLIQPDVGALKDDRSVGQDLSDGCLEVQWHTREERVAPLVTVAVNVDGKWLSAVPAISASVIAVIQ